MCRKEIKIMYRLNKETRKAINNWLILNDFDCAVIKDDTWEYFPDEELIGIPKKYDNEMDTYFMEFLRELGLMENFDCITLSLLHELGHHETLEILTNEEYETCCLAIDEIGIAFNDNDNKYYHCYWNIPSELMANEWLVNFANANPKICQDLEDAIFETLKWKYK